MPGKHDNDFKNGDIYGQPENSGSPERNGHFGKVTPDKEPAYYEETQMFNRPEAPKQTPQNSYLQNSPKQSVHQPENYPQNAHNSYGMTQGSSPQNNAAPYGQQQGGYPQNNPAPYGQQQGGYPQNNPNPYGQQQGGYPQNNPNPYGQQQGGYPQNNPNPYGQQQGGYPQNNPNPYGQQQGGYPQNNPNPYGQQQGGYPQNNPDPYRQSGFNPYLRERPEPVRNEQTSGKKKKVKKKQPMKTSTAVLIVVTLAIVLFGVVPATLIFLLKDKDDSGSSSVKGSNQTTSQTTETDSEEEEETTEETTEEQTESDRFIAMIDVVGYSSKIAESALRDAGFKVFCKNVYSDEVAEGKVVSQNYDPGFKIARGTLVTIEVSLGPEPTKVSAEDKVEVPDVKGMNIDKAIKKLESSGFTYEVVYQPCDASVKDEYIHTVLSQTPSYGVKREKGTKVTINVAKRDDKTPVATGKVITEETDLNVRKENNTDSEIIGKLPKGSNVDIIYEFEGWYAILYNGEVAFVSKDYVELPENANKIPQLQRSPNAV